jgi:predicted AlkP superfamily phosphohydrolase/phosphomutase
VRDIAVGIDRAIGEILADVDERTTVIVMACHGMTCKYVPQFMLSDILLKLGVARRPVGAPPPPLPPSLRRTVDPILAWGWHHTPQLARRWLEPLRQRAHALVEQPTRVPIDRAAGKCFPLNNNSTHGGIRVNVVGREPEGKVRPGAEFDAFVDELSRDLMEIVNVETGRRIVNRVLRKTDLFESEHTAHFPDLFVEWVGADPVRAIRSPKIGRFDREYTYCRTGEHVQAGFFIASGPGIAPGRLDREVSILDMAPTFCDALGVACDGLDGTPIAEIADPVRVQLSRRSASTPVSARPHPPL